MKIRYFWYVILMHSSLLISGNRAVHQARIAQGLSFGSNSSSKKKPAAPPTKVAMPRKIKRKGLQGYSKHKTFSQMDYPELAQLKEEQKKQKDWNYVIKCLQRMIVMCDSLDEKELHSTKAALIIELADILFDQQKYDDAAKWYTEFTHIYSGNKNIEYASYKAIVCASKKILSIDRDQSATEKTLELANEFLKRADTFTTYKKEVKALQNLCYKTLAYSDCNVAEFYLTYGNYQAAEQRLKSIRSQWLDKAPDITVKLASLEVELATVSPQFKVPDTTITLAELKSPIKKVDMKNRF